MSLYREALNWAKLRDLAQEISDAAHEGEYGKS